MTADAARNRDRRTGDDIVRGARPDDRDILLDELREQEHHDHIARASDHLSAFAPTPTFPTSAASLPARRGEARRSPAPAATATASSPVGGSGGVPLRETA